MHLTKIGICPCCSTLPYDNCCGPYHARTTFAPTPEKLMRSRYSAYVLLLESYLLDTWHISTRPLTLGLAEEAHIHPTKWLNLIILKIQQNSLEKGMVEFIAKYKIRGKAYKLHEMSEFTLENNQWFYLVGTPQD